MTSKTLATTLLLASAVACVGLAAGLSQGSAETAPSRDLRSVSEFETIADEKERSRALFDEAAKVITDPRCMNCHPANRIPTQGDDMHPHRPFINAGDSGIGVGGLACTSCHGSENRNVVGSRIRSVPGNAHWSLAPASMGWQGMTNGQICEQLKDPERNGGRSLEAIQHHMNEDHLVAWAWHPGEGRRPAPGTQESFGALIAAWIATGAACPG